MKKILLALALVLSLSFNAQLKIPQASPLSKVEQAIGLTNVSVNYNRPSAKGRTVFGELVPYGKTWRTGANENSIVNFSEDVTINGSALAKGKYSLYTVPKADMWEIIFYKTIDNWGLPEEWKESNIVLKVNAKPETTNKLIETFTISFGNITVESAHLELAWERTMVNVKIEVPTQKIVLKNIDDTLAGPKAGDFYQSAQYYFQNNGDLSKASTWINKAIDLRKDAKYPDGPFWYLRLKSLILAKQGDKKAAIDTAKLSLVGAEKEKNEEYVKQNQESIKEWSKSK